MPRQLLAALVAVALAAPPALAFNQGQLPFLDGFEHCKFVTTNNEHPLYSAWATGASFFEIRDVNTGATSPVVIDTGNACYWHTTVIGTQQAWVERKLPTSQTSLYSHVALHVDTLDNLTQDKPIYGHKMVGGGKGCYLTATESQFEQFTQQTAAYRLNLFFNTQAEMCDAGSRNPGTVCVADAVGRDENTCAETTEGEARCGRFPFAVATGLANQRIELRVDESHNAGQVTCGLWFDGRDVGTETRKVGTCAVDTWACATNTDCEKISGATYNGRCAGWVVSNPYPVDDSVQRCRTGGPATDCPTCATNADCGGSANACASGRCRCDANTCNIGVVANIDTVWIGPRDVDNVGFEQSRMDFDDWAAKAGSGTSVTRFRIRDRHPNANGTTQTCAREATCGTEYQCMDDFLDTPTDQINAPDGDATRLSCQQNGDAYDLATETGIGLATGYTCSGQTATVPGACSVGAPATSCFVNADCNEFIASDAMVALVSISLDTNEDDADGVDDNGHGKTFKSCLYDVSVGSGTKVCGTSTRDIGARWTNLYMPDGDVVTTAPDGSTWASDGSEMTDLGARVEYTETSGTNAKFTTQQIEVQISRPVPVTPLVIPDVNADGFDTVCIVGDSTYADSVLEAEIKGALPEAQNLLFFAAGTKTTRDVRNDFSDMANGSADPAVIPGGLHAKPLKGAACVLGNPAFCQGCDIIAIGIGLNSNRGFAGRLPIGQCYAPRTGVCDTAPNPDVCSAGKIGALCTTNVDCNENGDPCICANSSGAANTNELGYCLYNYSATQTIAFKGVCTPTTVAKENAGQGPCTSVVSLSNCEMTLETCTAGACQGAFWSGKNGNCVDNTDCARPVRWCEYGCVNAPGCREGICLAHRQGRAGSVNDWHAMANIVTTRNSDASQSNNVKLVAVGQPRGAYPGSAGGDGGCWGIYEREFVVNAGRVVNFARRRSLGWIHHSHLAQLNCPDGDSGLCTRDGIHYNDAGIAVAVDAFRDCFENRKGKRNGICASLACTQGRLGAKCAVNTDCDTYHCDFGS